MKQALLIAACLLWIGIGQQDANAQSGNNPGQEKKADATQNSQASAVPTVTPTGQANTEQHYSGQAGNEGQQEQKPAGGEPPKSTDWIQATIAVLLFVVVVWQAYISNQQRKEMREQREAVETTERAYIGIANMELLVGSNDEPTLLITWINGGKTPAWRFRCIPALNIGEKPEPKPFLTDDDFSDIRNSFIPAGAERPISYTDLGVTISKEVLDELRGSATKRLYAVMQGTYRDVRWKPREFEYWALYDADWVNPKFVEIESDYEKKHADPR